MTPKRFAGKTAFITGASRGIGRALAIALAREGCNVAIASKTAEPNPNLPGTIVETAKEVEALGVGALAIPLDVRFEDQIEAAIGKTVQKFGRIDFVVNNAGAISLTDVESTPAKKFDLMMGVNARASYLCSRAALPYMKKQKYGHILMMSPPISIDRAPGKTAYMLSKLGMTFIAQSLAGEAARDNIAVNALWPVTAIDTQATRHFKMGTPEQWRTADIVVDASLEIFSREPSKCTGHAFYDEDLLREAGVTDFSKYSVVPGTTPPPLSKLLIKSAL